MKIKIKTDKRENYFILEPIDFDFDSMPKLKIYLRNYEGSRINDGLAYLPINKTNAHRIYSRLSELITRKLRGEIILDEHCKGILREAQEEEQRFEDFAKHAYKIRNNEIDNKEIKEYTAVLSDGGFMRTLKPYQLLSSYHLAFSQNACNFSVPGSGKTSTVLAAYHYLKNIEDTAKHVDKLMVVGPLAAFLAWKSEFTACFGYTPKVLEIYGGINREKVEDELLKSSVDYDMIIVSYGSVPSKVDILQKFLRHNRTMVVLDEAHRIKNTEEGIQSYAALKLSQDAKSRVILTGTPAANNYTDLINLYKFIWPSKNIIGYSKAQLSNMSAYPDERVENLTKNISPFFVRIKKDDLGLPTPIYNGPIKVEMSPIQSKIYENLAQNSVRRIERDGIKGIFARSATIRMRQAATNPALLKKPLDDYFDNLEGDYFNRRKLTSEVCLSNEMSDLIDNYKKLEVPGKFKYARRLIENIIGLHGKIIVWCEFIDTCNDFSEYLFKSGIENRILYGRTSQEERENIIMEFADSNNYEFSVVIANPHAVGESISLHMGCHNALYLEQGFNAGTYMQSKDRIHRVGLQEGVETNYYYMHSIDTVDETIYSRVLEKESKMLKLIEKEEIPLLTRNVDFIDDTEDDIKAIIRSYYETRNR